MSQKIISLRIEIILMLAVKLTLLYMLWIICFSCPLDKNLTPENLSNHLFHHSSGAINHEHRRQIPI
jgi:hypothetical protein